MTADPVTATPMLTALIKERIAILHALAKALLEAEVLDAPQIDAIVNGTVVTAPAPAPA